MHAGRQAVRWAGGKAGGQVIRQKDVCSTSTCWLLRLEVKLILINISASYMSRYKLEPEARAGWG